MKKSEMPTGVELDITVLARIIKECWSETDRQSRGLLDSDPYSRPEHAWAMDSLDDVMAWRPGDELIEVAV
jgi:hypothetical protein